MDNASLTGQSVRGPEGAMVDVHGFCDERFAPIGDQFRAGFERGSDEGASLAVSMNGRLVVDMWGGCRDLARTKPWESDTLVRVASTSKVVVAIATLMVWDRGLIDLDVAIATYWPAFAQNGKEAITTRQVLVHSAGLPGFGRTITVDDLRDWDRMVAIVEQAPVWYEPGTITGYQHVTFGFILGELVHRVAGLPFTQFVLEEITGPREAEFHFALSTPRDLARVAELWLPPDPPDGQGPPIGASSMAQRVEAELAEAEEALPNDVAPVVIPSASGMSNARALARIGSIMAMEGEVDGRRYLSRPAVDEAAREQSYAEDQVLGFWIRRGLFFGLDDHPYHAPTPTTLHWGGYGGSWVTMDPASGISCAYTPNRWLDGVDLMLREAEQWQVLIDVLPKLS